MITVEQSSDRGYLGRLFEDPLIRSFCGHDGLPRDVHCKDLLDQPNVFFLQVRLDGERCGGFLFQDNEVHTMLLPPLRGSLAVSAGKKACDWLRANRDWASLTSYCYSCHPQTLWFAKRVGFVLSHTTDEGVAVNGVPVLTHHLEYRF